MQDIVTPAPHQFTSVLGDRHEYRDGDDMVLTRYDRPVSLVSMDGPGGAAGKPPRERWLLSLMLVLVFVSGMLVGAQARPVHSAEVVELPKVQ
jgi:hypothetical protein